MTCQAMDIPYAYDLVEKRYQIPKGLLYAIALTESGRTLNGTQVPWPWTLNIKGKGLYFDDRESMQATLLAQLAHTELIDIGPMQINWRWHKHRVNSPITYTQLWINLETGAKVLNEAYQHHQDWYLAVGRYHSNKQPRATKYADKVMKQWSQF